MRALIAARKSNKARDAGGSVEGQSLDTQDERAREFCDRLGWVPVGDAKDTISGRVAPVDRRQLGAWLATPGRFDVLVAYKSDRLSRGTDTDWSRIETWAADHAKILCLVDGGTGVRYPARDDSDFWQWTAAKRQAGREWDSIRERNTRSQEALVASKAYVSRAPWGYKIAGPKYAKRLEVDESKRGVAETVFRMAIDGKSLRQISVWVEGATGLKWSEVRVRWMINNWIYAGRVERMGVHYMDCPAIVDAGVLVAAQRAMRSRNRKPSGGRPSGDPALMVLACGKCGGRMYRAGTAYYCNGAPRPRGGGGCGFRVPSASAEMSVIRLLGSSDEPEMAETVIPAQDHSDEIERLRRDRRAALERDDLEAVARLTADLRALQALEIVPERVDSRPTGRTVGQAFRALARPELREALKAWTIIARPDGTLRAVSPWTPAE